MLVSTEDVSMEQSTADTISSAQTTQVDMKLECK